jgi:hypothetical protein
MPWKRATIWRTEYSDALSAREGAELMAEQVDVLAVRILPSSSKHRAWVVEGYFPELPWGSWLPEDTYHAVVPPGLAVDLGL